MWNMSVWSETQAFEETSMSDLKHETYLPLIVVAIFILAVVLDIFTVVCRWMKNNRATNPSNQEKVVNDDWFVFDLY